MKIHIRNFQCHSELSLELTPGEHCLLAGESGRGKSTIFRAITWCLYGECKDVAPSTNLKAQTSVEIETAGLKIYRQHNNCLLRVQSDGVLYEGEPAQHVIDSRLGNSQIWNCTTYMPYNFENPLVGVQPKKRMEYLDTLSFTLEKPSIYLQNADTEISLIKKNQETLDTQIKTRKLMLDEYVTRHNLNINEYLTLEQITNLERGIQEKKLEIENKKTEYIKLQVQLAQRTAIGDKLAYAQYLRRSTPEVTPELVQEKEEQLQRYTTRMELKKKLQALPVFTQVPTMYTEEEIESCRSLEYKREQMMKLCSSLDIVYNADSARYKQDWQDMLDWIEYDSKLSTYKKLQHEIQQLEKEIECIKMNIGSDKSLLSTLEQSIVIPPIPVLEQNVVKPPVYPFLVSLPRPEVPTSVVLLRPVAPTRRELTLPSKPESIVLKRPTAPEPIDTKEILREMQLLMLGKQLLHCPSCAVALRFTDNNLQLNVDTPEWDSEHYAELKSQLTIYENSIIGYKYELDEINVLEYKLNTENSRRWQQEVDLLKTTEAKRYQEATRQYEIELERIKKEEERQNALLRKEYSKTLASILLQEVTQNEALLDEYNKARSTYDNSLREEQELYQSKLDARYQAQRREEGRLYRQKIVSKELELNEKRLLDREAALELRQSNLVHLDPGSPKTRPNVKIENPVVLSENIRRIADLEWIQEDTSSKQMSESNRLYDIYTQRFELEHLLQKSEEVAEITLQDVNKLKEQLHKYTSVCAEILKLESELEQVPDCKQTYQSLELSIYTLRLELSRLEFQLSRAKLCTEAYGMSRIVEELNTNYGNQVVQMGLHQQFREIMVQLETQYYQDLIRDINNYLDVHTSYLFETDIRIRLSLTRPQKNGKLKKEVNLAITREGVHVSYSSLSDGERARVNLLLTCALNQLSSNNLLILDETLSCLDAENKHKCMEFITDYLVGTTLLMVNHEANAGDYTRKIDV